MKRGLTTAILLLLMALQAQTAAQASMLSTGQINIPDGVLYDQCVDYKFTVTAPVVPGYPEVEGTITAYSPDGLKAGSDYFDFASGQTSGTLSFFFCGEEMPGTYTARGEGRACNANYQCSPIVLASDSFTLRQPQTQTTLKVSPQRASKGQLVRFTIVSKDERPNGYFQSDYCNLWLESRVGGAWKRVKGSKAFVADGDLQLRLPATGKKTFYRAVRDSYGTVTGSASPTEVLRPAGRRT